MRYADRSLSSWIVAQVDPRTSFALMAFGFDEVEQPEMATDSFCVEPTDGFECAYRSYEMCIVALIQYTDF